MSSRRLVPILLLTAFAALSSAACSPNDLTGKMKDQLVAEQDADLVFIDVAAEGTLKIAEEGWKQRDRFQELVNERTWSTWLVKNGAVLDKDGNVTGGSIDAVLLIQSLKIKDQMAEDRSVAWQKWIKVRDDVRLAIQKYREVKTMTFRTKQEYLDKLMSSRAMLETTLHAVGSFTGGFAAGAMSGI